MAFFRLSSSMRRRGGENGGQGGGLEGRDGSDHLHVRNGRRNRRVDVPVVLREWRLTRTSTRGGTTRTRLCLFFVNL